MADDAVLSIVPAFNTIYVVGYFFVVGGQTRTYVAAIDPNGSAVTTFDAMADNYTNALALNGTDLLIGGQFMNIGNQSRLGVALISSSTGAPRPWQIGGA